MDGQRCPVCGGVNFQPCGKVRNSDGEDADGKRCLCCCYVFCDFDLALADKTRARLIAEVVQPWRELIAEAVRDRITDDWLSRARVQLGQSESVKVTSNEETT